MALEKNKDVTPSFNKQHSNENYKSKIKRDKMFQTKVVIRRLPPTMSEEQFLEQISPVPDHDYMHYVKADMRLGQHAFSRAYINFTVQEDIFLFKEKFDGYVFLDIKGNEYPAVVEFAPFQKIPKKRSKKRDTKCGTIFQDPDYIKFLESLKHPDDSVLPTAEAYLEEIEFREKELKANNGVVKMTTPLIEYLKQRKIEQQKIRDEKREERKRKELEKKRIREEERRRRKAEKEKVKEKVKDKIRDKESQSEKEMMDEIDESPISEDSKLSEPVVQVLKNPEREKEQRTHTVLPKSKEFFTVTRPSNKERSRIDWAQDRDKQRDRMRMKDRRVCEKPGIAREKERSRRDRIESRIQHSENSKRAEISGRGETTEVKPANIGDTSSVDSSKDSVEDSKNDAQNLEIKWANKNKRDNSCPGDVEPLGNKSQSEKFLSKQSTASSSRTPSEDSAEVIESCKSDGGLVENCDQSKDPRVDRRIRNKDRPSLEIYRPGMRRFSAQRNSPQKEISTSTSNSSTPSPSPTPPLTISSKSQNKDSNKNKTAKNAADVTTCSLSQEDI